MRHIARFAVVATTLAVVIGIATPDDGGRTTDPPRTLYELNEPANKAIAKGLEYLAKNQRQNGSWNSSAPVATTSMCCLAFMASGNTASRGRYCDNVQRGVKYLIGRGGMSGFISEGGGAAPGASGMHGHGFATMTLAEVLGTIDDRDLYDKVQGTLTKAVRLIERCQNRFGGWNASPDGAQTDDGSGAVAIMQIMALRAARNDGIAVRHEVIEKAKKYVLAMTTDEGWYQYNWNSRGGHRSCGLTGPGTYMIGALGEYDSPKYEKGIKNIMNTAPFLHGGQVGADQGWQGWFYYALFYCALAIFQHGGDEWAQFYPAMRDELVKTQNSEGAWEDPYGGLYTAFALLSLELPYRQLPFFQEGGRGLEGR